MEYSSELSCSWYYDGTFGFGGAASLLPSGYSSSQAPSTPSPLPATTDTSACKGTCAHVYTATHTHIYTSMRWGCRFSNQNLPESVWKSLATSEWSSKSHNIFLNVRNLLSNIHTTQCISAIWSKGRPLIKPQMKRRQTRWFILNEVGPF